jgi:PAS domain S-box-containing protein
VSSAFAKRGERLAEPRTRRRAWLFVAAAALAYFLASCLGIALTAASGGPALFWPAAGLGVAVLALAPPALLVPAAAAIVIGNAAANLVFGVAWAGTLVFAIANTGEALIAAAVIRPTLGRPVRLDRLRHVAWFTAAAVIAAAAAALAGAAGLRLTGLADRPLVDIWGVWAVADLVGIIAFAPAILAFAAAEEPRPSRRSAVHAGAVAVVIAVASAFFFTQPPQEGVFIAVACVAVFFAATVWITARCRPMPATLAPALIALVTMAFTAAGLGPFADSRFGTYDLYAAQLFTLTLAQGALVLGALVEQRRQAEVRLRHSEERLQLAQEAGGIGIWDWDIATDLATCSASFYRLFGRQPLADRQSFRSFDVWLHPDDRAAAGLGLAEALASGRYAADFRVLWPTGETRWLSARGRTLFDADGRPERMVGAVYDITARREAEHALRVSEDRVQQIATAIDDVIYIEERPAAGPPRITYINAAYERVWGGSAARLGADRRDWLRLVHPDDRPQLEADLATVGGRSRFEGEFRIVAADGSIRWIRDRGFLVPARADRPCRLVGIASDITRIKASEAALAESEARSRAQLAELTAIYESAPLGLCVLDRSYRYLRINPRLAEMNGAPPEAHLGRTMRDMVPRLADHAEILVDRVFASGTAILEEMRGQTRSMAGSERVWQTYWYPTKAATGEVFAVNLIVEEITERKAAEIQRELLLRELNHRVKNTLAVVQSIAEQTARSAPTVAGFNAIFSARVRALARAHALLTHGGWQGASLMDVFEQILAPFRLATDPSGGDSGAPRIAIGGPLVRIHPDAAVSLSMAVHELATNAAKYGSLSSPAGRLDANWAIEAADGRPRRIEIAWRESGGPPVKPPTRRGFGTRLIESGLVSQFDATVSLSFPPPGVECRISLPAGRVLAG